MNQNNYETYSQIHGLPPKRLAIVFDDKINDTINSNIRYEDKVSLEKAKNCIGEIHYTNQGIKVKIVGYMGKKCVIIEYLNVPIYYRATVSLDNLSIGRAPLYPYKINKYKGYIGVGGYDFGKNHYVYDIWMNMLAKCDENFVKEKYKSEKVYNFTVCDYWKNFQHFADWYYENLANLNNTNGIIYQVNTDILQPYQKEKVYSPQTCCIVPMEIYNCLKNLSFSKRRKNNYKDISIGVYKVKDLYATKCNIKDGSIFLGYFNNEKAAFDAYKQFKENYIKQLADYYLSINAIFPYVHDALYRIDIKPHDSI